MMESAYENVLEQDDPEVSDAEDDGDVLGDYVPSSSSSESDSDGEDSGYDNNDGGLTELTLVDEEPILIHQNFNEAEELGEDDFEDQGWCLYRRLF